MTEPSGETAPWPSARLGWIAVFLLSLAGVASYLDRVVIGLLVEPMKADFGLSDTGFAMLQGLAFGLFYTLFAFPVGRLADSYSRRRIIMAGLGIFSLFSIASGLSRHYWQIFLARTGVGIGEASLTPAAYSMLSDYFPPTKLGRALGAFTTSAYLGMGLAFVLGGAVIGWLSAPGGLDWWGLGDHKPWQVAFMIVGAPGLLLLIPLHFLLKEPARRGVVGAAKAIPLGQVCKALWGRRRFLLPMFAGFAMVTLPGYAGVTWTPAMFIRVFGWSPAQIGLWYGAIYMVFGMGGVYFGGWFCDRMTARGVLDAPLRLSAYGFIGFAIFGTLGPLMPDPYIALAMMAVALFFGTIPYPLAGAAIQLVTPNQMRGQTSAVYLTIINLVGLGLGPILVGLFTDHVFTEPSDVRYSLATLNAIAAPLAIGLLLWAAGPYRRFRAELSQG
ncbi:MFS transporter [Novosphingobium sp.]|uniref:spinster family MFS transporter n=1 Tax=Novosphingobium sp. TaxID=1874826 RepID=UPI00286DDC01|nr:MFS transporter [Novosphingobium sp.]